MNQFPDAQHYALCIHFIVSVLEIIR